MADAKRGKTCTRESRLVLVLLLIGWKSGASFLNQSRSVVNARPITFRHSNENCSISRRKVIKTIIAFITDKNYESVSCCVVLELYLLEVKKIQATQCRILVLHRSTFQNCWQASASFIYGRNSPTPHQIFHSWFSFARPNLQKVNVGRTELHEDLQCFPYKTLH